MNEMDRREFIDRMRALSKEQAILAARELPDRVLWDELIARFIGMRRKIKNAEKAMRMR